MWEVIPKLARPIWLGVTIAISVLGLIFGGDSHIVVVYLLMALTFPSGILSFYIITLATSGLRSAVPGFDGTYDFWVYLLGYPFIIFVGYIQWFVLVPKLIAIIRKKK